MQFSPRHGIFPFLLFYAIALGANGDLLPWSDTAAAINLLEQGRWLIDTQSHYTPQEAWNAGEGAFRRFSLFPEALPAGTTVWGRLRFEAAVPGDTLLRYLAHYGSINVFALHRPRGDIWESIYAGNLVPWYKLPVQHNFMAIPLRGDPGVEQEVLLQLRNYHPNMFEVKSIFLLTPAQEVAMRKTYREERRAQDLFFAVFFGITGFLFLLFALQWSIHRDRAVLYYLLYLAVVGLFYLRAYEMRQFDFRPVFGYVASWYFYLEVLFSMLSYVLYIRFVEAFLDLRERLPRFSRFMRRLSYVFLAAIPLLWGVHAIGDAALMQQWFSGFRFAFLGVAFSFVGAAWASSRRILATFIFTGTFFLLLGGISGLLDDIFGGFDIRHASGAWGRYVHPSGWSVPIYDFKVGFLIEICFFSLGIAYKQKGVREEYRRLSGSRRLLEEERVETPTQRPKPAGPLDVRYPFAVEKKFTRQVVAEIEVHLSDETFSVEQLAHALHLSREQVYRKTKAEIGHSPNEMIHLIRLWEAYRLLARGELSVAEVSFRVGFNSPSYFTQQFKKEFGCLPREVNGGMQHL